MVYILDVVCFQKAIEMSRSAWVLIIWDDTYMDIGHEYVVVEWIGILDARKHLKVTFL